MRRVNPRAAGVTLVEILVVLVILSIALSVVVPTVGKTYENWVLRSTGRRAAALFRYGEETARRYGANVACYQHNQTLVLSRSGSIIKTLEIPASITVQPQEPKGAFFLPTGQIVASEPFVLQNRRGRKVRVEFGPMPGQVGLKEQAE